MKQRQPAFATLIGDDPGESQTYIGKLAHCGGKTLGEPEPERNQPLHRQSLKLPEQVVIEFL